MSESRSAPTVARIVLGVRLKALREEAGFGFDDAAHALRVNPTTVRRMEKAEVGLKPVYVEKLLEVYGTAEAEREAFLELVEESGRPGWWARYRDVLPAWFSLYVSLEESAQVIRSYEPHWVPGLLQTSDYARALLRVGFPGAEPEELERRVALRVGRQALLGREDPPRLWTVVDEAALRRPVGGPAVMRAQLDALMEASRLPHVMLQVMPFSAGPHPAMSGPCQLFRFELPELPDIAYAENLTGALYLDERKDTSAYLSALDSLGAAAAPLSDTERILRDLRKEYTLD